MWSHGSGVFCVLIIIKDTCTYIHVYTNATTTHTNIKFIISSFHAFVFLFTFIAILIWFKRESIVIIIIIWNLKKNEFIVPFCVIVLYNKFVDIVWHFEKETLYTYIWKWKFNESKENYKYIP